MRPILTALLVASFVARVAAQQPAIVAASKSDAGADHFQAVLKQALAALARAGSYSLDVESRWNSTDAKGPQGGHRYKLQWQAGKYHVEVTSLAAESPELVCVNDGSHVTTYYPPRKLYSQHTLNSPRASLQANTMLAMSLQGSAIDILLQRDVVGFVHSQASGLHDHGQVMLNGKKARHFDLLWAGAKVELWFAAEGDPLLLQFTRTTSVPTAAGQNYDMVSTATFHWQLPAKLSDATFAIAIPADARRVTEIYDALAGDEAAAKLDKPLPKLQLATLDGNEVDLSAANDKKATVLIFWATWCASSVEDLPAVSKFVHAYKDRGVAFYAVNVGQQPGDVRRFTAKHPLVSTVLLDPRSKASSALHIAELPAIAVVGPDNHVRAILHGTAPQLQGELTSQLDTLLTGSSTARRPGETGRAK